MDTSGGNFQVFVVSQSWQPCLFSTKPRVSEVILNWKWCKEMHKGWGGYSSLHIQSFIQKPIRNYRQCNFSQSRCRLSGNFNIYLCICLGYKIKASDFFQSENEGIVNFIIHQMFVLCDIQEQKKRIDILMNIFFFVWVHNFVVKCHIS